MKKLLFTMGKMQRKIMIDDRVVTMITPENNYQPVIFNIEKIIATNKMSIEELEAVKAIKELSDEERIANDIIEDFKMSGWEYVNN